LVLRGKLSLDDLEEGVIAVINDWLPPPHISKDLGSLIAYGPLANSSHLLGSDVMTSARTLTDLWVFSFFWLVSVISGAWVPVPKSSLQTWYSTFLVFVGFLFYAAVIAQFTTAWAQLQVAAQREASLYDEIDQSLCKHKVPDSLRKKVLQFYAFSSQTASDTLQSMRVPHSLRVQLEMVMHRNFFLKVPFFKACELSQITALVPLISREHVWHDVVIVSEASAAIGLHMIVRGFVSVTARGVLKDVLAHPNFFGEEALLTASASAWYSAKSITQCELMTLAAKRFDGFLECHPHVRASLTRFEASKVMRHRTKEYRSTHLEHVHLEMRKHWHLLRKETRKALVEALNQLQERVSLMSTSYIRTSQNLLAGAARRKSSSSGFRRRKSSACRADNKVADCSETSGSATPGGAGATDAKAT